MADIKIFDPLRHRELTGIGNEQILENAAALARTGIPYILRTPVIPGINDTPADIGAIAAFIAGNRTTAFRYYELLNFNPLGASKYEGLGVSNQCRDGRPLSDAAINVLAETARAAGIPVRVG
jgi:pyruvate formate lyase activating enzyme